MLLLPPPMTVALSILALVIFIPHYSVSSHQINVDGSIIELTDSNIDAAISTTINILIDLYAPWRGHCKRLAPESIDAEFNKKMDHPSNGLSVFGCLRPAFVDEESYLRRLFFEASDGYILDWNGNVSSMSVVDKGHDQTNYIWVVKMYSRIGLICDVSAPKT